MANKTILFLVVVLLVSFSIQVAAEESRERNWEIKNYQAVRLDTQNEEDNTYLTRAMACFDYNFTDELDITLKLQPFIEAKYLWDRQDWDRMELGAELGFQLTRFGYIGESFHYAWLETRSDTPELETRLAMYIPFVLNSKGYEITLELLEEYTYAIDEGEATRNEIAANLIVPLFKNLELLCGWRHIDRIHDYDSDQVELGGIFTF